MVASERLLVKKKTTRSVPSYSFAPASLEEHTPGTASWGASMMRRCARRDRNDRPRHLQPSQEQPAARRPCAPTSCARTRLRGGGRQRASPRARGESSATAERARPAQEWMESSISRARRGQPMTRPGAAAGRCARAAAWRKARVEQPGAAAAPRAPPSTARPPPPHARHPPGCGGAAATAHSASGSRAPPSLPGPSAPRPLAGSQCADPPSPAARTPGLRPPRSLRKWQTPAPFFHPVPLDWTPHAYSHPLPRSHPG